MLLTAALLLACSTPPQSDAPALRGDRHCRGPRPGGGPAALRDHRRPRRRRGTAPWSSRGTPPPLRGAPRRPGAMRSPRGPGGPSAGSSPPRTPTAGTRSARRPSSAPKTAPFVNDCAWHLWQGDLKVILGPRIRRDLHRSLAPARRLHDTWLPVVGGQTDFEMRFWPPLLRDGHRVPAQYRDGVGARASSPSTGPAAATPSRTSTSAESSITSRNPRAPPHSAPSTHPTPTPYLPRCTTPPRAPTPLLQQVLDEQYEKVCVRKDHSLIEEGVSTPDAWARAMAAAASGEPLPHDP